MPKRNKTYSLDDVSIELLQEMADLGKGYSQSGILNQLILQHARQLCKSKAQKLFKIRSLIRLARQQQDVLVF